VIAILFRCENACRFVRARIQISRTVLVIGAGMNGLTERLETAGKWACLIGFLLAILAVSAHSGALLVASGIFLGPAFLMPAYVDLLRTRAALAEVRSRHRLIPSGTSTLPPPQAVGSVILRDPCPDQDAGNGWVTLAEWDSPSRTIH
jgi:hypothetical protein